MRRIRTGETIEADSWAKRAWNLTWGLVLVVGLTIVSECGLQLGYSKSAPDAAAPVVSQPVAPAVK
jgi:hypothetical protein